MTYQNTLKAILNACIALVWLINGLYCKVLDRVPRHRMIVASILGPEHSSMLTTAIGALEIAMAIWIVTGIKSRWCAWLQIIVVAAMNGIEFVLVPDLLLFGHLNIIFATIFCILIYVTEFMLKKTEKNHNFSKTH